MSVMIGTRLGPYEVVAPLGAGGMGEVYRARDTKLHRDVAIKVLPEAFAADADRLVRFTREAQVLASLNHPNIAAIYGIEERALVMELVEGEDLSAQIARGALPMADALHIARQVAEALEAAHEAGVIHRDLKPQNIKVRADGTVKVLDFGLAKAADPSGASSASAANSPTLTAHATQLGMIIGTAAYMSPEQAKGKPVDRRADIWAFGVVLFEMLTGRQAFSGDSITEILGAVVLKDPDWSMLPSATPTRLRELLQRCLQRDLRTRQRGMGDVTLELAAIATGGSGVTATTAMTAPPSRSIGVIGAVAVTIAILGITIGWQWPRPAAAPVATSRFIVNLADRSILTPAISPDGRVLVFSANGRLHKRDLAAFESTPLAGTEGATVPTVSPDGRWVAFFANGQLKKVSLAGGDPTTITEANSSMPGAVWGPDDTIYFSRGWATGLSAVLVGNGQVRQLTEPDRAKGERGHWRPQPMPDGQHLLFTIMMAGSGVNDARIAMLNLKSGQYHPLFPGTDGVFLPSGHVLYFHAGAWHVVPFDASSEKTTGEPVTVLEDAAGIAPDGGDNGNTLTVAKDGTLAYLPGPYYQKRELMWMDKTGRMESLGLPPHTLEGASLSPDGRRIAVTRVENGTFELWINGVERKTEERLDLKGSNFDPVWSPHGDRIAFSSLRSGQYDFYTARPDGSDEKAIATKDFDESPVMWLRDGRFIEKEWRPDGTSPITLLDPSAGNSQEMLLPQSALLPLDLSPDDRWLLYAARKSGTLQVFVTVVEKNGATTCVSSDAGGEPWWSPDGHEIYFRQRENLVAVSFRAEGGRVTIGPERVLCALPAPFTLYGVSPDNSRFLVGRAVDPSPTPGVRVVTNWFAELKSR